MNALNQLQALGLELIVIPPLFPSSDSDCVIGERFSSPAEHRAAISEVQRFRGRVYVADGAIPASALDEEGRHYQEFDFENYHLCLRNSQGDIGGCFRLSFYRPAANVEDLKLYELIERMPLDLAQNSHAALRALVVSSRAEGVHIVEAGGWGLDEELRQSRAAMLPPLAGWALCQIMGDALVAASATTRHHSSTILKRIGGFPLMNDGKELPPFMDDYHGCEMELVGFDSRKPHPKYEKLVAELKSFLLTKIHVSVGHRHPRIENEFTSRRIGQEPVYA
jgi:hypothetical protein